MNGVKETSVQIFQFLWTRSNISAKITESRIRALFKVPHGFVPGTHLALGPARVRRQKKQKEAAVSTPADKASATTVCFLTQRI